MPRWLRRFSRQPIDCGFVDVEGSRDFPNGFAVCNKLAREPSLIRI